MATPISGNQNFSSVRNPANSNSILRAVESVGLVAPSVSYLEGTVTPTAAGDYAVVDAAGNTLQVPTACTVLSATAYGPGLVGGTSINVGGAATNGGAVVTSLTGGVVLTAVLIVGDSTLVPAVLGATNYWISATSAGVFTAGSLRVVLQLLC